MVYCNVVETSNIPARFLRLEIQWNFDFSNPRFLKKTDNSNQKLFPLNLFSLQFYPDISNFPISRTNFRFPKFSRAHWLIFIVVISRGYFKSRQNGSLDKVDKLHLNRSSLRRKSSTVVQRWLLNRLTEI